MSLKVLNKKRSMFFALLMAPVLPFAFAVNIVLFLALAMAFILFLMNSTCTITEKFLIAFCASVLFSGISVLSLRPYDIIIIFALFYVMKKKQMSVKICKNIFPFLIIVVCVGCIYIVCIVVLSLVVFFGSLLVCFLFPYIILYKNKQQTIYKQFYKPFSSCF